MRHASKTTRNWWMIFKPFTPEPYDLWIFYLLSMGVTLLLFFAGALSAYGVHGSWTKELTISCITERCSKQRDHWNDLIDKEIETKIVAAKRIEHLKRARLDSNNSNFNQSWNWFEAELDQLEGIKKSTKYRINSIIFWSFPTFTAFIFGSLLFYVLMNRLVLLHAKSTYKHAQLDQIIQGSISNWKTPQILIGMLISATMITSELFTSVLATEKTWFGYDSFCVTPSAFVVKCIAFIAFGFVASTPFTILWCLSGKDYIPYPDPSAKDGKFGVERYVEFLQTWTLWLILAPSALGIFLFRYVVEMESVFSPVRLLYGCGVGIVILLVIVRLITNAIILRFRCRDALTDQKFGKEDRVPVDPTISFLGTEWWKLPATITVSLTTIWALLEFIGLSKIILNIVQIP